MSLSAITVPTTPGLSPLEKLKGAASSDPEKEKARLKKATQEFESFFMYQMLKAMRKTVPESELTSGTSMSGGMGKETFTDFFDMEIARKVNVGGGTSISQILYNSLEKLIDIKQGRQPEDVVIRPLDKGDRKPVKLQQLTPIPLPDTSDKLVPIDQPEKMLPINQGRPLIKEKSQIEDPILEKYGDIIERVAKRHNLDSSLIASIIKAESSGDPTAVSHAGAKGLMQLTDSTASDLNVSDPFDPAENINAGSKYLRKLLDRFGDTKLALAAYNAGPGNVAKYGGVPPFKETENYINKVEQFMRSHIKDFRLK